MKTVKYTKAYLVKLTGMGDYRWYLLNEEDWKHLDACANWNRHGDEPAPVPPDAMIDRYMADNGQDSTPVDSRAEAIYCLTPQADSGTADNDVALSMAPSLFNGESYNDYDGSVRALNAFLTKHKLKVADEYEGGIY